MTSSTRTSTHGAAATAPLSVAFHGLDRAAEAATRSMLQLLLPMLGNRWRICTDATSDVVVTEPGALEAMRRDGRARPDALYVVVDAKDGAAPGAFCNIQRPINGTRLIEVLHKAQAEIERRCGDVGATTVLPTRLRMEMTATERSIETTMRVAVRWILQNTTGAVTVFSAQAGKVLSAVPARGYVTRLSSAEIADLLRSNPPVKLLTLTPAEEKNVLERARAFGSLGRLEWIFWIAGSNGELRTELRASKPYRLSTWPDFSRLPHYRADVRMASLLKSTPLTVGQLAERADVRFETAVNFVNACCALGYLTTDLSA